MKHRGSSVRTWGFLGGNNAGDFAIIVGMMKKEAHRSFMKHHSVGLGKHLSGRGRGFIIGLGSDWKYLHRLCKGSLNVRRKKKEHLKDSTQLVPVSLVI